MNRKSDMMKSIFAMMMTFVALALISGCGGGGGNGSTGAAAAPAATNTGNGRASLELHFGSRSAGREAGAVATGTITITVSVTGYYGENDAAFTPVTTSIEIPASGGYGTASLVEVPVGVNHLMTAEAVWPDGATDTIKCIIPEILAGEIAKAVADRRTTLIADAAVAMAERDNVKLSKITQSQIDTIAAAVDSFTDAGYGYDEILIADVLDYATNGNVVASIEISPSTATVAVGASAQFTAVYKNVYGIIIPATSTWSVTGGIGTVSTDGLFTATTEGNGTVVTTYDAITGSASVSVFIPVAPPVCGNSMVESGETCDDGNTATEACTYGRTSCTVCDASCQSAAGATSYCGDSVIDSPNGETCDDGANNGQPGYCSSVCNMALPSVTGYISAPTVDETFTNAVLSEDKTKLFLSDYYSGLIMIYDLSQGGFTGYAQSSPMSLYLEKPLFGNTAYSITADMCSVYASDELTCSEIPVCQWNATSLICEGNASQTFPCNFDTVCDSGEDVSWCSSDCVGQPRVPGRKSGKELKREARQSLESMLFYLRATDLSAGTMSASMQMENALPGSGFLFAESRNAMYYLALIDNGGVYTGELRRMALGSLTQTLSSPTTRLSSGYYVGMAIDDEAGILYVPDENDNTIYKYDLDTLAEIGSTGITLTDAVFYDISAHKYADGSSYLYAVQSDGFSVYNASTGANVCSYAIGSSARESESGNSVVGVYEPYHHVYIYDSNSSNLLVLDAVNCSEVANLGNIMIKGSAYNETTRTMYIVDGSYSIYVVQYQE